MKYKKIKVSAEQASFELILGFFLFFGILKTSLFSSYLLPLKYIYLLSYILLFIRGIYFGRYSMKDLVILFAVFTLSVIITLSGNESSINPIIGILFFSFCARKLDFNHIIKFSSKIIVTLLVAIIISSKIGIILNYTDHMINGRVRQYLGFLYALYPAAYMLEVILMNLYLKESKVKLIFLLILDVYIYKATNSRLSFYLSFIAVFLMSFKFFEKAISYKPIKFIVTNIYNIFAFVSTLVTIKFNASSAIWAVIDIVLTYRLTLGKRALEIYGVSPFGGKVEFEGAAINPQGQKYGFSEYLTVDNGYLDTLIKYGYVTEILLLVFLTIMMIKLYESMNYRLVIIFIIISIHLCIDFSMLNIIYDVFLLALFNKTIYVENPSSHSNNSNY